MSLKKIVSKYEPMDGADYIGDAGDLWVDLETGLLHVSDTVTNGGNVVLSTDSYGLLNLPGNVIIGNVRDGDTVVWAGEDAEYAGLWWGGNRDLSGSYFTYASITVGNDAGDDMGPAPSGTIAAVNIGENYQWTFDGDTGSFSSAKNIQIDGNEGQFLARQNGGSGPYGGYSFVQDGSHDTGLYSGGDGNLQFYNNAVKTFELFPPASGHADTMIYGTFTLQPLNYIPTGRAGMMAMCDGSGWNGGGDGLQHLMVYINGSWQKVF